MKLSDLLEIAVEEYLLPPEGHATDRQHQFAVGSALEVACYDLVGHYRVDAAATELIDAWRLRAMPRLSQVLGRTHAFAWTHWYLSNQAGRDELFIESAYRPLIAVDWQAGRLLAAAIRKEGL